VRFLFDTDHLVKVQRRAQPGWERLREHLKGLQATDVCLCSVTFHEQLLGANAFINRSRSREQIVRGYEMLERSLGDAGHFIVLPFDAASAGIFDDLRRRGVRIGTMDLRIATVALWHGLTLLTQNAVDFAKVPGLDIADWTRE
jgi:tRNA(fMet)-specific endonuclease VapC